MSKETLQKAVDLAGGQVHLARGIKERLPDTKIGQVHVWGWLNSVKMEVPPAEAVIAIADTVGWRITPHELREDIYPNVADGMPSGMVTDSPSGCTKPCESCAKSDRREEQGGFYRKGLEKRMQCRREEDV